MFVIFSVVAINCMVLYFGLLRIFIRLRKWMPFGSGLISDANRKRGDVGAYFGDAN